MLSFFCPSNPLFTTDIPELDTVDYCIEKWPMDRGRSYYSVFSMVFQYAIPIIIVTVVSVTAALCMRACPDPLLYQLTHGICRNTRYTGIHGHPEEAEASNGEVCSINSAGLQEEEQPAASPEDKRLAAVHCSHLWNFVAST